MRNRKKIEDYRLSKQVEDYEMTTALVLPLCLEVLLDIRDILVINQVVFTIPSNPERDKEIGKILSTIFSKPSKKRKE